MRVHHLNCGTMHPLGTPGGLVCHVLLVETDNALALIDSGLGLHDAESPAQRFGPSRLFLRPAFDPTEAAITQIRRLGFDPHDVQDIVLTHFDADHTGGLSDFPWARVHLTNAEAFAAQHPRTLAERGRYRPIQRAHGPLLVEHEPSAAESWHGFPGALELTDISPGIVLINLPGHTRGHAAIAVDAGDHWVLHAGDSFYHHGQLDGTGVAPRVLTTMERLIATDWTRVQANHQRLTELWTAADSDLQLINAHDPHLLNRVAQRA